MLNFIPGAASLQILWRCDPGQELECLPIERLESGDAQTFAIGAWPTKKYYYTYPVTVRRTLKSVILSNYRHPPEWPTDGDWKYFDGTLTISLASDHEPQTLTWVRQDSSRKYVLERDLEWQYFPPHKTPPEPRGRIAVNKVYRPLQGLIRIMLLSTMRRCAISDCEIQECLEAAHVLPVKSGGAEVLENMILLRADLHRLFDAGLLSLRVENGKLRVFSDRTVENYVRSAVGKGSERGWLTQALHSEWIHARLAIQPGLDHVRVDA